jgi:4-amino-4-deoxy-L-arabinose transferase-like glycosyltransferase
LIVILVGLFLAVRNIWFKEILQGRNKVVVQEKYKSRSFALWLLALSIFLISLLIRMLSRPVSDALAYYLVQPRVIALTEKLTAIKDYENFLQSSAFIEMNLASTYSLSGELCTRLYILYCGLLLLKVVLEICSLLKSSSLVKQVSILLLITSTFITNTMADGKTDNISTYWFMSAFAILLIALNRQSTTIYLLIGFLLGLSVLSKVSYVTILPGLFAFALYRSKRLQTEKIKQKIQWKWF